MSKQYQEQTCKYKFETFFKGRFLSEVLQSYAVLQGHKPVPGPEESPQGSREVSDLL